MTQNTSRRRFLKAAAATGVLAGLNATVLAQGQDEQVIVLGGLTAGWQSYRLPGGEADSESANPTLNLEEDTTYTVLWQNIDSQPHNFAIQDSDGNNLQVLEPLSVSEDVYQQVNETDTNESVSLNVSDGNVTGATTGNMTDGNATENMTGDGEDDSLVDQTETVSEEGAVQAVRFTASEEMASYICLVHPNTMVGDISLGSGGGDSNNSSM
jgi:hypothetical protein